MYNGEICFNWRYVSRSVYGRYVVCDGPSQRADAVVALEVAVCTTTALVSQLCRAVGLRTNQPLYR